MSTTSAPRVLPRGPHRLARDVVAASQRDRLLDAVAEAVADHGYGEATVGDVVARAGVSRKTFYAHFRDKLDCFLAAYDMGVEVLLATMREAGASAGADPLERTRRRIRAYLETLAAEPAFARTFLLEITAAGPEARARRRAVHEQFAALGRELALEAGLPAVADELHLAAVAATNEVVSARVLDGRTAELPHLEDVVLQIHLALVLGPR